MNSEQSTDILALYTTKEGLIPWFQRSMTPEEIRRVLRLIDEAGMRSEMRIAVWLTLPYLADYPDAGRHSISPSNWSKWFDNYTTICVQMAEIAEQGGCDILAPFTEMASCMLHTSEIRNVLDAIDSVFTNQICISQATCALLDDLPLDSPETMWMDLLRENLGQFWDWQGHNSSLIAGIEWWPGFASLDSQLDQRFTTLAGNFVAYNRLVLAYFRREYPDCPVRFDELGAFNYEGSVTAESFDYSTANVTGQGTTDLLDHQEFADSWAAFLVGARLFDIEIAVWSQWITSESSWYNPGLRFLDYTPAELVVHSTLY